MVAGTVLLDLDGTVWDNRLWFASTIARLSRCDASEVEAQLADGANVVHLAQGKGISKTRLVGEATRNNVPTELYEGVIETLDRLREKQVPIAVVSNLSGSLVAPLLHSTGLNSHFTVVITPGQRIRAKPQPHGIRHALRKLKREEDPWNWYVGDEDVDAKASQAARVRFAWASYGYENQKPDSTDTVIDRFEDVVHL